VPFVPASGGHSLWSTIDENGFILDLGLCKNVVVNSETDTVTVTGGLLMKELQAALATEGRMTTVGSGNTVGVIPYFINGGTSIYSPLTGYGCDNIVSAKLVTANGQIVKAEETQNQDLLWALRGAGQFFGIVLELTIKTYPLAIIGNPEGIRQIGTFIFPVQRAPEVFKVMSKIVTDQGNISAGHFIIGMDPRSHQQVLMVCPQFLGTADQASKFFQPLVDLGPVHHIQMPSSFATHSDHLDMMSVKGEFKRFTQIGLDAFHFDRFADLIELHSQLIKECPGAERSGYTFEWHSPTKKSDIETSFGNRDVTSWLNLLSWYSDPKYHEKILQFDQKAQAQMRKGIEEKDFVAYTNTSRTDPLEYRYKGEDRIAKLKALKRKWDPNGIFTKQLL